MDINSVLPDEMLDAVFRLLPHKSFLMVLLVCRRWREVGESPWFWAFSSLRVTFDNLPQIPELLASRRWMALSCIIVRDVSNELLTSVQDHRSIKRLEMNYLDLSLVDPELLATAVADREVVDMRSCRLTNTQANAIFTVISNDSRLQSLEIGPMTNLSTLEPGMMAKAVNRLKRMEMRGTHITREQVSSILHQAVTHTRLHYLDLRGNWSMGEIPLELVRAASRNIRVVYCK